MNDSTPLDLLEQAAASASVHSDARIERAVQHATDALLALQRDDGHWLFELEADATIPSEYVLMKHYFNEPIDHALEAKIANYLRRLQTEDGGWPLTYGGVGEISASVKAYFALKVIGDSPDAPHMQRARALILQRGGAANCNVFTRVLLAMHGILTWRAVPVMPVEVMLFPRWFAFHLSKVSYWARTVVVPLLVLSALRPLSRNPERPSLDELFLAPPAQTGLPPKGTHQSTGWFNVFCAIDVVLRVSEPWFPKRVRRVAIDRAVAFVTERLNGKDGLGAIFPAMVNTVQMFDALGVPPDRPDVALARASIDGLLVIKDDEAYCQPCLSPVWDTALMAHTLLEVGSPPAFDAAVRGLDWLKPLQILDTYGDWVVRRPGLRPGGWAFQYANPHYPDVDDTAVVVMAMDRAARLLDDDRYHDAIERAAEWVVGMQSRDGGWGAFEPENTQLYLNNMPFADHGALLDPPTSDVSARCLSMLAQIEHTRDQTQAQTQSRAACAKRALGFLLREQEDSGSWYGRWGMNHVYGTWSSLCALNVAGLSPQAPSVVRAAQWLIDVQNEDGGWGEDGTSYRPDVPHHKPSPSTASQTAWALLGLMMAGLSDHVSTRRGVEYLLAHQGADGLWDEPYYTATGFPDVFYLRYHGYAKYFPLWALARYRNILNGDDPISGYGM